MKTVNMPKKRELSNDVKEISVTVKLGGLRKNKIGELLGIHRSTIGRVLKKFQEKGRVENNPDSMTTLGQRWQTVGPLTDSLRWEHNVGPTFTYAR